jgi:NitT/TauT family transport system ATP-binding protein
MAVIDTSGATPAGVDPTAAPALAFREIRMVYPDGTEAIGDVSLDVRPGELVTIVGPSGCGKSTLLRIASGLLRQTAGTCEVDHEQVGYIFQDATLLPWRTVQRNVELLLELQGAPRAERQRLVQQNIDLVGLTGFESYYPKRLSGGMKMRVSLARSLACNPKVFLFDDPFGALDEITRERLQDELLNIFVAEGFAGLFITHSIQEACFLSTRVLVMCSRPGRITAEFAVPFDYPRKHDIRYEPEFAELNGRVSAALRASSS